MTNDLYPEYIGNFKKSIIKGKQFKNEYINLFMHNKLF